MVSHRAAQGLLFALMAFVGEEAELGAPGAFAFLAANFGDALGFVGSLSFDCVLDFVKQ
jgi:hypothetical protein